MTSSMLELAGGIACLLASMAGTWFFLSSFERWRCDRSTPPRRTATFRPTAAHR